MGSSYFAQRGVWWLGLSDRQPGAIHLSTPRQMRSRPGICVHARSELGRTGVVSVETPVGRLAVGISNGRPFAVSDTCRHLFASLGEGRVLRDGCLQCPWHRSRYDVTTGRMVRGPQGLLFLSVREIVRAYTNLLFPLKTYPVVDRGGVLHLDTGS